MKMPSDQDQENAIYAAYLGICVLQTMVQKVGLTLAVDRCAELLKEMDTAFPFIREYVGRCSYAVGIDTPDDYPSGMVDRRGHAPSLMKRQSSDIA
jgi:hypothetical protein